MIHLREYKKSDFEIINELWMEYGLSNQERNDSHEMIQNTINQGGFLLVMEDQETSNIIGCSWVTNDGRRLYLHHFFIKREFRKMGHGKQLLDESLKRAQEMGLQIKLEVHDDNKRVRLLYKNAGFKYLGDFRIYIRRDTELFQY